MPATFVALLRGINVGGKNILPMKELTAMFCEAGCGNVRSHIQSGNVFFEVAAGAAARLPGLVEERIEKKFGFRPPVILRNARQLREVVENNPFY